MLRNEELEASIVTKYSAIASVLDERARRLWAAAESRAIGYGGDSLVGAATGLARDTIRKGRLEIERGVTATGRIRGAGAGRPSIKKSQPGLEVALERLVDSPSIPRALTSRFTTVWQPIGPRRSLLSSRLRHLPRGTAHGRVPSFCGARSVY